MLLSETIVKARDANRQDIANCRQMFEDMQTFYDDDRIVKFMQFIYAFSWGLPNHKGPVKKGDSIVSMLREDFRKNIGCAFSGLRKINDKNSQYPDEHRVYENIISQQSACLLEPEIFVKPSDIRMQALAQKIPSDYYKLFRSLSWPYLFEQEFLKTVGGGGQFWVEGDSPALRFLSHYGLFYILPRTDFVRILCLIFVATDRLSPYVSDIFLVERMVDGQNRMRKTEFQRKLCSYGHVSALVPIFRIQWDNESFCFR